MSKYTKIEEFDYSFLEGPIDCVINYLDDFKKRYEAVGYTNIEIVIDIYYDDIDIYMSAKHSDQNAK